MDDIHTFSLEEIALQEQKILNFSVFRNSPTLSKFLKFIISETVHEKCERIKEYSIAIHVLNRPANFNSHDDAVVRIHAGRLRRALDEYYFTEGKNDAIVIQVPKGCYIPQFISAAKNTIPASLPQPNVNPLVALFPFKIISQTLNINEFAVMLAEELSAELSRFQGLSVINYYSTEMLSKIEKNIIEAARSINADYIISGNILCDDGKAHIRINTINAATGEVIMTKLFEKDALFTTLLEIQEEIVEEVNSMLGDYFGFPFKKKARAVPLKISIARTQVS